MNGSPTLMRQYNSTAGIIRIKASLRNRSNRLDSRVSATSLTSRKIDCSGCSLVSEVFTSLSSAGTGLW